MKKLLIILILFPFFAHATVVDIYSGHGDGYAYGSSGSTWASTRGGAGSEGHYTENHVESRIYLTGGTTYAISRGILQFNTSVIPAGSTINSATVYLWGDVDDSVIAGVPGGFGSTTLTTVTTASTGSVVPADFAIANYGSAHLSNTNINWINFSTTTYNTYPLNATGIAYINTTGTTSISWRQVADIDNYAPGGGAYSYYIPAFWSSENASDTPYLEINYTAPVSVRFTSFIVNLGTTFKVMLGTTFLTK